MTAMTHHEFARGLENLGHLAARDKGDKQQVRASVIVLTVAKLLREDPYRWLRNLADFCKAFDEDFK